MTDFGRDVVPAIVYESARWLLPAPPCMLALSVYGLIVAVICCPPPVWALFVVEFEAVAAPSNKVWSALLFVLRLFSRADESKCEVV